MISKIYKRFVRGLDTFKKIRDNEKKINIISDAHGSVFHGAEQSGGLSSFRR